ncbi:hypothetical protein E3N88_08516 [Mikania micrantha]|uniref:C2 domain-containing protein n=1 Tax=Mikania micrantha TaxID=192012 RepID=A0A5N6PGF3_9ASTR|nr:hypothetical protein E3N88_08516 [Mikania micrantha]
MADRSLELTIISAKGLKKVNLVGKMDVYAVVYINGAVNQDQKQKTPVDKDGDSNPTWNYPMKFQINESDALQNRSTLVVKIKTEGISLYPPPYPAPIGAASGSYPPPAAAVAPGGYPPAGGTYYPPPAGYPQPQAGYAYQQQPAYGGYPPPPPPGYGGYPPQPGYGYPPVQQPQQAQKKSKFGMGLGAGLLGGALGGLLIGDIVSDAASGCGGGGCGGGCGGF